MTAGINISDFALAAVMTAELITIAETAATDIFTAIRLFREHRIRHLPIVGKSGNPIGIITHKTIMEFFKQVDLLRSKKVSEVMRNQVIHAPKTVSVLEVAKMMTLHRISCVVITEKQEILKPIGIVTERDIVQFFNRGLDLENTEAQAVMSAPLFPIKPEDSMWNAKEIMQKHRVRRLVVSNDLGEMVGIITQTEILDAINPLEIWQTAETLQRAVENKTSELNQLNHQYEQEINRRQKVEAALQESQRWLQAITEANPNIIYVYDLIEKRNVYSNREMYAGIGYSPAEIQQMGSKVMQNLMHPEDLAKIPQHFQKFDTAQDGEVIENHYRMRHKNGEWRWFSGRDTVFVRNADGSPKQILGSARDISDRQQAEAALQQSQARLQKIAANIPGMIYEFQLGADGTWNFPYVSSGCREIYELEPEQMQENAELCFQQLHPDDRQSINDSIAMSAQTLAPWNWEGMSISPSGKVKWLQGIARPEKQENGDILWHGILIDASDRKLAEDAQKQSEAELIQKTTELEEMVNSIKKTQAQLIHSEKMSSLGKLVSGVAHEINNPVSFIYGNIVHVNQYVLDLFTLIELYQQYDPAPAAEIPENIKHIDLDFIKEDLPKTLISIHAGASRIRKIVVGLRNFSQHDRSEIVAADINQCLEDTLLMLSPRLQPKADLPAIAVSKNYGKLPTIQCFSRELNQVFMNILSNAIDALEMSYCDPGLSPGDNPQLLSPGMIWISTEISDNLNIKINISNNGPSIPTELQQKIFDPFFTTKSVGQGAGLGLYASYQIVVEKHQGKLQCVSASGHGTSFLIYLPTIQ